MTQALNTPIHVLLRPRLFCHSHHPSQQCQRCPLPRVDPKGATIPERHAGLSLRLFQREPGCKSKGWRYWGTARGTWAMLKDRAGLPWLLWASANSQCDCQLHSPRASGQTPAEAILTSLAWCSHILSVPHHHTGPERARHQEVSKWGGGVSQSPSMQGSPEACWECRFLQGKP